MKCENEIILICRFLLFASIAFRPRSEKFVFTLLKKWCSIDCSYESKDFSVKHREAACINAILLAAKEMSVCLLQDSWKVLAIVG